jgi:hypothetical protein
MPRSLGPCMKTSFVYDLTYLLAPVVIMIRMTVTPIPIRPLLLLFQFSKGQIRSAFLADVLTIDAVFVIIPIVIVLVVTVVDLVVVLVVPMIFFLPSIVLSPGRSHHARWSGKGCSEQKRIEKISIAMVMSSSSWLEISVSETSARKECAFAISQTLFDRAPLAKSFEITPNQARLPSFVEAIKHPDRRPQLLPAFLSSHTGPCPLRTVGFQWYRHPSDNWQPLR